MCDARFFMEGCFLNQALFADHYLATTLLDDAAWREDPQQRLAQVEKLLRAVLPLTEQDSQAIWEELYEPIFKLLGFTAAPNRKSISDRSQPDYFLCEADGSPVTAAFTYAWDRWLDGPDDGRDRFRPDENPGGRVVSALAAGLADWLIVTNGRQWRLYSRRAHSRATSFYEVDLPAALIAPGDPNRAFRYWWLFFRKAAFVPVESPRVGACRPKRPEGRAPTCWLDRVAGGSNDYARELGERLRVRISEQVFPYLAQGFLPVGCPADRQALNDTVLKSVFQETLTLLYRLLFLLYAESRELLPTRDEAGAASLTKIRQEIAEKAGNVHSDVETRLRNAYSADETTLHDRLCRLFAVANNCDAPLNVPSDTFGPFLSGPSGRKASDRVLAHAIDLLSRDANGGERTESTLTFIDYKSLSVRHLGTIYEGLLEFQLKVADEDLAAATSNKKETYVPLAKALQRRGRHISSVPVVRKGNVYLSNDRAERKASGSYYTPDPIVKYIIEHTVGPVLDRKLESLRPRFGKIQETFDREYEEAIRDKDALESDLTVARSRERRPADEDSRRRDQDARAHALDQAWLTDQGLIDELFEFRTLDPAMGSGHFLVEAVSFITDRLLTFLSPLPANPVAVMLARSRETILEALAGQGVSVAPDKLTDVSLLKRHVLRHCVYGVDLNPMAVELARVSLWLDAFAIGAPLSFLNHRLRCGNSLIGATVAELRAALPDRRIGIDDEPLLRAVHNVVSVNTKPDADSAEVTQSARKYDQARDTLSGYQLVLDLLAAKHFGYKGAPDVLTQIDVEPGLSSRHRIEESLPNADRLLVGEVTRVAQQSELRFFHWEIEFPEVFFGFAAAGARQLKDRNEILKGSAGFDAVVGNPPYAGHKGDFDARPLARLYKVCRSYANPATAFLERGLRLLRTDGRLGMIVPKSIQYVESWDAARRLLADDNRLIRIADVSQAFDGVLLEQTVCIAARQSAIDGYAADTLEPDGLIRGKRIQASVPEALGCFPARIRSESLALLEKLLETGPRLGDIARTSQALGYQARLNRDVTGETVPIFRGKQVRPMRINGPTDFIDRSFLLSARSDGFTGKVHEMLQPKVVSQNIVAHVTQPRPRVWVISAPDPQGVLCLNTISTTIIRDERFPIDYVAAVLNSTLASWFYTEFVFCRAIRTMHFDNYYAGKLPMASITANQWSVFSDLARDVDSCSTRGERQRSIDAAVFDAYGLSAAEREFLNEYCYGSQDLEGVLTGSR